MALTLALTPALSARRERGQKREREKRRARE